LPACIGVFLKNAIDFYEIRVNVIPSEATALPWRQYFLDGCSYFWDGRNTRRM